MHYQCYRTLVFSRWVNTGSKIKYGEVGFPKYDTMVLIADFFNLDVGFLIGETDEDSLKSMFLYGLEYRLIVNKLI